MTQNVLPLVGLFMLLATSLQLLISQSWRTSMIALALQYLAVFLVINSVLPTSLAAVKIVAGWMTATILGASQGSGELQEESLLSNAGQWFHILAAGAVWILVFSLVPSFRSIFPVSETILWSGLVLIGMGLLQMGMTSRPLRVIIGLLTAFSGFEILYASLEGSVLLMGLLAIANLCIALVGAYLMMAASGEELE